tara:strand:+ start:1186 stop:2550 length:1365 start_codon:yes stop_codon:yes gene_type:complete
MPLQIRRGTEAERQLLASPPQQGELVYITDSEQLYVGDGTSLLRDITPITGYTDENALDYIGSVLDAGPHTGISFAHDDGANTISATIDPTQNLTTLTVTGNTSLGTTTVDGNLAVTGKLTADFNGTISGDDSTILVDGVDNKINLDGTVKGHIVPNVTETYDIGTNLLKFRDLYLSGSSLHLGDAEVTATGTAIDLPVGSTVGGVAIMGGSESVLTDIQGSVFGDDSSVIVNAVDNTITVATGLTIGQSLDGGATLFDARSQAEGGVVIYPGTDADSPLALATLASTPSSVSDVLTGLGDLRRMTLEAYKGTIDNPTQLVAGDILGAYAFSGQDSPSNDNRQVSAILAQADPNGTITTDRVDQKIHILVAHGVNGASTKKFTFDSAGQMAINQENASATLDVNGFAKLAILTAEPASAANGMIAIADGTSWNPTGSGNQTVVAYVNGAWAALS